jgi:hypothetical protein
VLQVAAFLNTTCRLPVCISFMQTLRDTHRIPWKYARVVAGFCRKTATSSNFLQIADATQHFSTSTKFSTQIKGYHYEQSWRLSYFAVGNCRTLS